MILTSLRCYINALVPTTDKVTLLKSPYFILDVDDGGGDHSNEVKYDTLTGKPKVVSAVMNKHFNITYCPKLFDPIPHVSDIAYLNVPGGPSIFNKQKSYLTHLKSIGTMTSIYNRLYNSEVANNQYPKILIMFDDMSIIMYGQILAAYLSDTFGEDVIFIDESLRPEIFKGGRNGIYVGNVSRGKETVRKCKNQKMWTDLERMFDAHSKENTRNDVIAFLSGFDAQNIGAIYDYLFPDKPLPARAYTKEEIIQLTVNRICDNLNFRECSGIEHIMEGIGTYEQQLNAYETLEEMMREELAEQASFYDMLGL